MTELQVKAAQLAEDRRHNMRSEQLQHAQNAINQEHYERSDTITGEHYKMSDAAGLISANASAMNAQAALTNAATNRKQYELAYSLEYLPQYTSQYGDKTDAVTLGYGSGLPLSAQKKIAEIENLTLNKADVTEQNVTGHVLDNSGWHPVGMYETHKSGNTFVDLQTDVLNATGLEKKASAAGKVAQGVGSILNSIFGKSGVVGTIHQIESN